MPFIKTKSGLNWHFHSQGQGQAVLFIHGWSFDESVWFKQIDSFISRYRVITLDLPGHGQTNYKSSIDIIEEVKFIVEELGLKNINLVGHSLGGFLSLQLVSKYPELIKKLVLIGAPAKFVESKEYSFGLRESDINKLKNFLSKDYPNILLVFMRWLFTKDERGQKDFRSIWEKLSTKRAWPQKEAMADFLFIIEKEDIREQLSSLNIPTLIICGTGDPICPVESMGYLNKQIKDSKVKLFPGCGHLPFLTQAKRFNKVVKEFLG